MSDCGAERHINCASRSSVENDQYRGILNNIKTSFEEIGRRSSVSTMHAVKSAVETQRGVSEATSECAAYVRKSHSNQIEALLRNCVSFSYALTRESIAFDGFPDSKHPLSSRRNGLDAACFSWELFPSPPRGVLLSNLYKVLLPVTLLVGETGRGRLRLHKNDMSGNVITSTTRMLIDTKSVWSCDPAEVVELLRFCSPTTDPSFSYPESETDGTAAHQVEIGNERFAITLHFERPLHATQKQRKGGEARAQPVLPMTDTVIIQHRDSYYLNRIGLPLCLVSVQYKRPIHPAHQGLPGGRWLHHNRVFRLETPAVYLNLATPLAHSNSTAHMLQLVDTETERVRTMQKVSSALLTCVSRCRRTLVQSLFEGARAAFVANPVAVDGIRSTQIVSTRISRFLDLLAPLGIDIEASAAVLSRMWLKQLVIALTFYEIISEMHVCIVEGQSALAARVACNAEYRPSSESAPFRILSEDTSPEPGTVAHTTSRDEDKSGTVNLHNGLMVLRVSDACLDASDNIHGSFAPLDMSTCCLTGTICVGRIQVARDTVLLHNHEGIAAKLAMDCAAKDLHLEINSKCSGVEIHTSISRESRVTVYKRAPGEHKEDEAAIDVAAGDLRKLVYSDGLLEVSKLPCEEGVCPLSQDHIRVGRACSLFEYNPKRKIVHVSDDANAVRIQDTALLQADVALAEEQQLPLKLEVDLQRRTARFSVDSSTLHIQADHQLDDTTLVDLLTSQGKVGSSVTEGGRKIGIQRDGGSLLLVSNALKSASSRLCNIYQIHKDDHSWIGLCESVSARINLKDRAVLSPHDELGAHLVGRWIEEQQFFLKETLFRMTADLSRDAAANPRAGLRTDEGRCLHVMEAADPSYIQGARFLQCLQTIEHSLYIVAAQLNEALRLQGRLTESARLVESVVAAEGEPFNSSIRDAALRQLSAGHLVSALYRMEQTPDMAEIDDICSTLRSKIHACQRGTATALLQFEDFVTNSAYRFKFILLASIREHLTHVRPPLPDDIDVEHIVGARIDLRTVWARHMNLGSTANLWLRPVSLDTSAAPHMHDVERTPLRVRLNAHSDAEARLIFQSIVGVAETASATGARSDTACARVRQQVWARLQKFFHIDACLRDNFNIFHFNTRRRPFVNGAASLRVDRLDPLVMTLLCVKVRKRPFLASRLDPALFGGSDLHSSMRDTNMVAWDRFVESVDRKAARNREELASAVLSRLRRG